MKAGTIAFASGTRRRIHSQRGQGLTEVAVAMAAVLIPAFLGVVYIAKVGESRHKVIEASRYGAWERTVWARGGGDFNEKSDHDINREINQRIFTMGTQPIDSRTDHEDVDTDSIALQSLMTTYDETSGDRVSLLEPTDASFNRLRTDERGIGGLTDEAVELVTNLLDLDDGGLHTIDVAIDILPEHTLLMTNELVATGRNAIYTGTWSANGPDSIEDHIENAVPSSILGEGELASATESLTTLGNAVGLTDFEGLEWGYVEPDRVPCQRLMSPGGEC